MIQLNNKPISASLRGSRSMKRTSSKKQLRANSDSCLETGNGGRCSNSKHSRRRRRHSVSFAEYSEVKAIPTLEEYTDDEVFAMWFTIEEMDKIFKTIDRTIKKMEKNGSTNLNGDKYCSRGLEALTTEGEDQRFKRRSDSFQAVFDKQFFQEEFGSTDPEMIARVYSKKAFDSRVEARLKAIADESEVQP